MPPAHNQGRNNSHEFAFFAYRDRLSARSNSYTKGDNAMISQQQHTVLLVLVITASMIASDQDPDPATMARVAVMEQIAEAFGNQGHACLYAPSRDLFAKKIMPGVKPGPSSSCPFCTEIAAEDDANYFILKRGKHTIISLNPFPYIQGHMLVMPITHKARLRDLTQEERDEWGEYITLAVSALEDAYHCPGAQIGSNFGRCAGASIPGHLHTHIIPATEGHWAFINILGNTVVLTKDLPTMYKELKPYFEEKSDD